MNYAVAAHDAGATFEAEIGEVPRVTGEEKPAVDALTDPDEAAEFAQRTGVDALAIAIGSVHAVKHKEVELDLARLAAIRARVSVPLVLHGSSGVTDTCIQAGILGGLCKVNVATQLNQAFTAGLRACLEEQPTIVDPRVSWRRACCGHRAGARTHPLLRRRGQSGSLTMLTAATAQRPILCVNPNAAIDKTVVVHNFSLDKIHRPQAVVSAAGGKGCNVTRVLRILGETPIVTGWVGGHAGRYIEAGLRAEGISPAFTHSGFESRTCLSIYDPLNHTLTEIYESGEPVSGAAQRAFCTRYRALLERCALVTLSGSLPVAVPDSLYADLIRWAHRAGVPVLLDSSREPLRLGLAAGPSLIKPNRFELCTLLGQDLTSFDQIVAAARGLSCRHATAVVVSLGAEGAVAVSAEATWHARPPPVLAQSAVGSGDAMLAGLAIGLTHGQTLEQALRLAVAAGAANTLTIGAGRLKREDVDAILPGVTVQRLQ